MHCLNYLAQNNKEIFNGCQHLHLFTDGGPKLTQFIDFKYQVRNLFFHLLEP